VGISPQLFAVKKNFALNWFVLSLNKKEKPLLLNPLPLFLFLARPEKQPSWPFCLPEAYAAAQLALQAQPATPSHSRTRRPKGKRPSSQLRSLPAPSLCRTGPAPFLAD